MKLINPCLSEEERLQHIRRFSIRSVVLNLNSVVIMILHVKVEIICIHKPPNMDMGREVRSHPIQWFPKVFCKHDSGFPLKKGGVLPSGSLMLLFLTSEEPLCLGVCVVL